MSNERVEGSPSKICGQRTPLRSVENEKQHPSTPPRRKSKSLLTLSKEKDDAFLGSRAPPPADVTQTVKMDALGLTDITLKSSICSSDEAVISQQPLPCAEDHIILPQDQSVGFPREEEEMLTHETCSVHVERPYCHPEQTDAVFVEVIPANAITTDTTWESFGCDSSKVEVLDISRQPVETILITDADYTDQPNQCQCEGAPGEVCDVTLKSFTCSGGEVEILNETKMIDEMVPLPVEQTGFGHSELSFLPAFVQVCSDHFEHPYCRFETNEDTRGQEDVFVAFPQAQAEGPKFLRNSESRTQDHIQNSQNDDVVVTLTPASDKTPSSDSVKVKEEFDGEIPVLTKTLNETYPFPEDQAEGSQFFRDDESHTQDHIQKSQNDDVLVTLTPASDKTPSSDTVKVKEEFDGEIPVFTKTSNETFPFPEEQAEGSQFLRNNESHAQDRIQKNLQDDIMVTPRPTLDRTPGSDGEIPVFTKMLNEIDPFPAEQIASKQHSDEHSPKNPLDPLIEFPTENQSLTMDPIVDILTPTTNNPPSPDSGHLKTQGTQDDEIPVVTKMADDAVQFPGDRSLTLDPNQRNQFNDIICGLTPTSVASALQLLTPIRRASMSLMRARMDHAEDRQKKSLLPDSPEDAILWADNLESPMPHPILNSTTLSNKPQPEDPPAEDLRSRAPDAPLIPDGPLQQQLRQMAEFLILASGKMNIVAPAADPPAKSRSVCVGVTPLKKFDRSINTSREFERKGDISKADACTFTDPLPLLWNCPPGSLDGVPRVELEQRLMSSMIMVEALAQQLAAARAWLRGPLVVPPPSELRNKLVQTDHTELSQTTMYRDLYLEALNRIGDLEQDGRSLQELVQYMQGMRATMTSLNNDTNAALSHMKQMETFVQEDHRSLVSHYGEMKSLCTKFKETQKRMTLKIQEAFQQRDEMKTQVEEAQASTEAAFSAMEQLRTHCASEISALQRSSGSQQELLAALNITFPEQVALNKSISETLNSASTLLCQTIEDQSNLTKELSMVRNLVHRTAPLLVKLNKKAAAALTERDEHMSARHRAQEEREQLEEELQQSTLNLQAAEEQICDLNLQVTILTSEMGVLREKLKEREEERGELERTLTEMSATVSSTKAAHTFLEHTLAEETAKLEEAQREASKAKETADQLMSSLCHAEERADELSRNLAAREEDLSRLQELSLSQSSQIQQLRDVCAQLRGVAEINEFLQAENEVAREQLAESENMFGVLHERNLQCEDLKAELCQLQQEKTSVQEELEATRTRASAAQLKQAEELAQAVTDITMLHHTLRGVTNALHDVLGDEKPEPENSQPVMVATTAENEEETNTLHESTDAPGNEIFSKHSAFSPVITKKNQASTCDLDKAEMEEESGLSEVLVHLNNMVTELVSTLKSVQRRKDARAEELQRTVYSLEMALQDAKSKHRKETSDLKRQLSRMHEQAERGEQALRQQAQDSKTITKLMNDVTEAHALMYKHRSDYHEMRRETTELRRNLQKSEAEVQILRGELSKASQQPVDVMEEKLQMLKELEHLRTNLKEMEQAKAKLLERAKRNQQIQEMNQQKCENEVQMLNNVINKVRGTLLSLPEAMKTCEKLQQLLEYLG